MTTSQRIGNMIDPKLTLGSIIAVFLQLIVAAFGLGIYYQSQAETKELIKNFDSRLSHVVEVVPLQQKDITNDENRLQNMEQRQSNLATRVGAVETGIAGIAQNMVSIQRDSTDMRGNIQDIQRNVQTIMTAPDLRTPRSR